MTKPRSTADDAPATVAIRNGGKHADGEASIFALREQVARLTTQVARLDAQTAALLLTVEDMAALLALSVPTVRRLSDSGKIPAPLHFVDRLLWRRDEIIDWLAAGAPDRKAWRAMNTPVANGQRRRIWREQE